MKFSLRHQSAGKIYQYLEPVSHLMFYGFFRKVYLHNYSGVPSDKPVLLAANHPTAFIDPMLLCCYLDPPIYNMTRGDIFKKPFFRMLMEGINMFPVYRMRDGYNGRDRNDEVFDYCVDKLRDKRVVTIYVEGEHHLEKRVRPVQKGVARIAFAAYERHQLDDLQIVPAGCNYDYGDRPRDVAMVNVGAPIFVKDYWNDYQRDPIATLQRLCNDIESALWSVCYHIKSPKDDALAERLLALHRSEHPEPLLPIVTIAGQRFYRGKALLDRLNILSENEKDAFWAQTETYWAALEEAGLDDAAMMNPQWGGAKRLLLIVIGFLPSLIGRVGSWPLIYLAKKVAGAKAKKREFYTSIRIGVGFLFGVPYYFLLFLICLLTGKPLWIALGLALPFLGWSGELYREVWQQWWAARKAAQHPEKEKLLQLRNSIRRL